MGFTSSCDWGRVGVQARPDQGSVNHTRSTCASRGSVSATLTSVGTGGCAASQVLCRLRTGHVSRLGLAGPSARLVTQREVDLQTEGRRHWGVTEGSWLLPGKTGPEPGMRAAHPPSLWETAPSCLSDSGGTGGSTSGHRQAEWPSLAQVLPWDFDPTQEGERGSLG